MTVRHRHRGLVVRTLSASALALGLIGAVGAPAHADASAMFTTGTGIVGVPQTVSYMVNVNDGVPRVPLTVVATGSTSPTPINAFTFTPANYGANSGQFTWVPPHVGTWNFSIASYSSSGSTFINQVGTTTSVSAPNSVKVGVPVTISATVTANSGSRLAPLGQVQFAVAGGANIGGPVWLSGTAPSSATVQWTPATLGQVGIVATYTPYSSNGVSDTNCGTACTSAVDNVQVTASGASFFLSNAPVANAGTPVTLQAVVGVVPPSGSVTFYVNSSPIASNVPVPSNGIVQTQWNPPAPGTYTLSASWVANNGVTGQASEPITVGSAPSTSDVITLTPSTGGGTWTANGTYSVAGGTSVSLAATAASGGAVTLSEAGPCTLSGNVLTTPADSAQCRITATSPGGNGYGPATAVFTVTTGPGQQIATIAAPPSGRIKVGQTLTLESPDQGDTNAGQNITWRVTKGKKLCSIGFPSSGAVTLKIKKKGYCTVVGEAPGIPGQWLPYSASRTYQGF